ncbi:hypothetical protein AAFC00_002291 [Neodothiora populina]|uniref:Sugar phosphate transporter domain-containing protein n=1 Tax=Neodothiora populina TaxID=2781224 RepID=A0ABR3PGX8_9PEZI
MTTHNIKGEDGYNISEEAVSPSPSEQFNITDQEQDEQRLGLLSEDVEKQSIPAEVKAESVKEGAEYLVSTRKKLSFLAIYFALNLGLTLYNKAVLGPFKFPWLLTALHTAFASLGCLGIMILMPHHLRLTRLSRRENYILIAFSFLFTINIAISNVSLAMVSVPFHQIARSTTPVATVLLYKWLGRSYSTATYLALVPIILGVGLSTFGDYYATLLGASLTFFGVFLAAVKTVATNRLLTGSLKLPALEVLLRMAPLAAVQSLFWAYATGEVGRFVEFTNEGGLTAGMIIALLGNGFLAFLLNITSFQTNKMAGALTLTVCGNVKQCLTVLLGVLLFNVHVGLLNGVGMMVALGGAAWYSKVEIDAKRATSAGR